MSVCLGIPTGVTAFSYIQIYRHILAASKELHEHTDTRQERKKLRVQQMATKSQFAVFILYLIMYLPFGITAVGGKREDYLDLLHTIAMHLRYLNSCINCILYGVLNKDMRNGYLESIPCMKQEPANKIVSKRVKMCRK